MKHRNYKSLDRFLVSRDLPKFSPLFVFLLIAVLGIYLQRFIFVLITGSTNCLSNCNEPELIGEAIEANLISSQAGLLPCACLFILLSCLIKKPNKLWLIGRYIAGISLLANTFQIALNFGIHLVHADDSNVYLFVARFIGLTLFVYLSFLTLAICRMARIDKKTWKIFDILMLLLALFSFAGTVLQKATGDIEIVGACAVVSATIAFALKFSKMTCKFNEE